MSQNSHVVYDTPGSYQKNTLFIVPVIFDTSFVSFSTQSPSRLLDLTGRGETS